MTTFTFTTDDLVEAQVIINALDTLDVSTMEVAKESETNVNTPTEITPDTPVTEIETDSVTPAQIAGILKKLSSMSEGELIDTFGSEYNKPYRVLKGFSYREILDKISVVDIPTTARRQDIDDILDYIIKDVSCGGMSHDTMEELFDVRTSKKLFHDYSLDYIVNVITKYWNEE